MMIHLLSGMGRLTGCSPAAPKYLEQSRQLAEKYNFYRALGQSMIDLAGLYRDAGDLKSAEERASVGLKAGRRVGDRYNLRRDLTVLANLKPRRGAPGSPQALYQSAE